MRCNTDTENQRIQCRAEIVRQRTRQHDRKTYRLNNGVKEVELNLVGLALTNTAAIEKGQTWRLRVSVPKNSVVRFRIQL